jgi:hypothetical protein
LPAEVLYNKNNIIILYLKIQRFLTKRTTWSFCGLLLLTVKLAGASENALVESKSKGEKSIWI